MFTQKSLRNIPKSAVYPLLTIHGFKNVRARISGDDRYDYNRFIDFFKNNFEETPNLKENLDKLIKENLFFNQMNQHYVYDLTSFLGLNLNEKILLDDVLDTINKKDFNLNKDILDYKCSKEYDICSTAYDTESIEGIDYLTNLRFIIFAESIEKNEKDFNLFCTIDIDFNQRFVSFKFNTLVFDYFNNQHQIIDNINNILFKKDSPLSSLNIGKQSYNLSTVRNMIQSIFIDLSEQAEEIIKQNLPPHINTTIENFINDLGIDYQQVYRDQIISVVYQDIGANFNINDFKNGWVFRFLFNEGDNTRASSRSNNNLDHIYSSQIYWNLKELMFDRKGTEFIEAGFLWNIDSPNDDYSGSVSVRIEQNNDDIRLNFYAKTHNSINRREKEKVVLQNIRKGLSTR